MKGFDVLRVPLHEREIRGAIGGPGEGSRVVSGIATLEAAEDRCLYFVNAVVSDAVRAMLAARSTTAPKV